ncbi:hypothetical protein [Mucilaginibacter gotjawali]|uniref:Uncharacterized protein n=1 Tax=Mucilaginibacter gotjawali TaxID=1550579 RepID=A0A839SBW1_9SPHI|nr:hypothetical protein [Mucilaginibacter gotjawali]MBB3054814.1 hypothetical protein [Mucilaginibacter gotjawali]
MIIIAKLIAIHTIDLLMGSFEQAIFSGGGAIFCARRSQAPIICYRNKYNYLYDNSRSA